MDSKAAAGNTFSSSLECQIARIYYKREEKMTVELVPVHQQKVVKTVVCLLWLLLLNWPLVVIVAQYATSRRPCVIT